MKTIAKQEEPSCLLTARDNGLTWSEFHREDPIGYRDCLTLALLEQGDESAYTGLWLGEGTTQTVHLDHFRKKVLYPELTFQWQNLFAAAKDLDYGSDYKDRSISGPRSQSDRRYLSFFSPLEANLSEYFWYMQDGTVIPDPNLDEERDEALLKKILNTIDIYNLNANDLKRRRRGVIEMVRGLGQLDDETVRACMATTGFSFVVEFELRHRAL